jgi:prevent-host-death family protein
MIVNIEDLSAHTRQVLERVAKGEEVLISDKGQPLARLTPLHSHSKRLRPGGMDRGRVEVSEDFDAPLSDDVLRDFEG